MRRVITAGLVALTLAAGVSAQDYFQFQRRFQRRRRSLRPQTASTASFNFCRSVLHQRPQRVRRPGVVDRLSRRRYQLHDPPGGADQDPRQPGSRRRAESRRRPRRLARALRLSVRHDRGRRHRAASPPPRSPGLRAYLLKGGFLWSDDFWGTLALESFEAEIGRVLPEPRVPVRRPHAGRIRSSG